jgi:hypothetical protein
MEKREKVVYEKRSQKDYSMSFKLGVVQEVESGLLSVTGAKKNYSSYKVFVKPNYEIFVIKKG